MGLNLAPGQVVNSKYTLKQWLGEGGMGVVWEATHEELLKNHALKFPIGDGERAWKRLQQEARGVPGHKHLVEIHDLSRMENGTPFIVMELLRGKTLSTELKARTRLDVPRTIRILNQVTLGVEALHEHGYIHRDIKPSNIFLCEDDGRDLVKILDFGLKASLATSPEEFVNDQGGSNGYEAPEQRQGASTVGKAADVWALGAVLYECLSGSPWWAAGEKIPDRIKHAYHQVAQGSRAFLRRLPEEVPAALRDVLEGTFQARPEKRIPLSEMREVLRKLDPDSRPSQPPTPPDDSTSTHTRSRSYGEEEESTEGDEAPRSPDLKPATPDVESRPARMASPVKTLPQNTVAPAPADVSTRKVSATQTGTLFARVVIVGVSVGVIAIALRGEWRGRSAESQESTGSTSSESGATTWVDGRPAQGGSSSTTAGERLPEDAGPDAASTTASAESPSLTRSASKGSLRPPIATSTEPKAPAAQTSASAGASNSETPEEPAPVVTITPNPQHTDSPKSGATVISPTRGTQQGAQRQ